MSKKTSSTATAAATDTSDNVASLDAAREKMNETVEKTREAVGERLETAREKFQSAAKEVNSRLHEASASAQKARDVAWEQAQHAREEARERYRVASAQLQDGYAKVRTEADYVVDDLNDFVRQNPGTAILIAAGAGFLLGLLFRPRRSA